MQGSVFRSKNDIYSPLPFWKGYFVPSHDTSFLDSYRGLFALFLPYFAFNFPFYFPFPLFLPLSSIFFPFLPPFFLFLSPYFLFLLHFPPFSPPLFIFFPPNDISWYSPLRGVGIFQYIDPWSDVFTKALSDDNSFCPFKTGGDTDTVPLKDYIDGSLNLGINASKLAFRIRIRMKFVFLGSLFKMRVQMLSYVASLCIVP